MREHCELATAVARHACWSDKYQGDPCCWIVMRPVINVPNALSAPAREACC